MPLHGGFQSRLINGLFATPGNVGTEAIAKNLAINPVILKYMKLATK